MVELIVLAVVTLLLCFASFWLGVWIEKRAWQRWLHREVVPLMTGVLTEQANRALREKAPGKLPEGIPWD